MKFFLTVHEGGLGNSSKYEYLSQVHWLLFVISDILRRLAHHFHGRQRPRNITNPEGRFSKLELDDDFQVDVGVELDGLALPGEVKLDFLYRKSSSKKSS